MVFFAEKAVERFESLGFTTATIVLDATEYGVPQKRSRFFIVGSYYGHRFEFPSPAHSKPLTVSQAISDLPSLNNGASESFLAYEKPARTTFSREMRNGLKGSHNHFHLLNQNCHHRLED